MTRQIFKELFIQYIDDGFKLIDLELKGGAVFGFDFDAMDYLFYDDKIQFILLEGFTINIDYNIIKSLSI